MGMTSVSVVMTVKVLNFHHRGPFPKEPPQWIRWLILGKLRRLLCMNPSYNYRRHQKSTSLMRRFSQKLTTDPSTNSENSTLLNSDSNKGRESINLRART